MATSGRSPADAPPASALATSCRDAEFVRLVAAADGDALAGAGVLADGLSRAGVPFQLTVARPGDRTDRTTDADLTVALGGPDVVADISLDGTADAVSHTAFEAVRELGSAAPDPVLAMAGIHAAGGAVGTLAEVAGIEREPGVAVPTTDLADGLAHSTLVHAPFSGDRGAATEALAAIDTGADDAGRRVASLLSVAVLGEAETTPRGAETIEGMLRPYAGGPFETIGGYADVLDAAARVEPGTAAALALGQDVHDAALSAWRDHAVAAHQSVRSATTGRYDGLFVARDEGDVPVGTVARLLRDYRSPEPVVLALTDGLAGMATTPDVEVDPVAVFREAFAGSVAGTRRRATATFERDTADAIMAVREAMQS